MVQLAAEFGADILICNLIDKIALECPRKSLPWERPPDQYDPNCKARFTDLEATIRQ
jgi:hypothetical protein